MRACDPTVEAARAACPRPSRPALGAVPSDCTDVEAGINLSETTSIRTKKCAWVHSTVDSFSK